MVHSAYVVFARGLCSAAVPRLSAAELRSRGSALFSQEKCRQQALITRTEKIEVSVNAPGQQGTLLIMNKGLSSPLCCARHLSEWHVRSSALALVEGELWPMHRPLTHSCSITLLTFKDSDPQAVNEAYWRSCAAMLGQVLQNAFKDNFSVELMRSPDVPVASGAFCCDFMLDHQLDSWLPSEESLRSLTRDVQLLIHQDLPFEPLEVSPTVALQMFSHSRCKQREVEEHAAQSPTGKVTLYRCGDHVSITSGPLVTRTGLCSQYEVTAVHNVCQTDLGLVRRAQGLSLPLQLQAHHTIWRRLRKRSEQLVQIPAAQAAEAEVQMSEASTTAASQSSTRPAGH